ncbi:MAG: hypothetical protein JZD41_06160 [Thermoproteus sp.]|nr:hypothetical protein [Thermoproteus sp.]
MDCGSICGVYLRAEPKSSEEEILSDIYSAYRRLGPRGACYVICINISALCKSTGDCGEAAREFARRYRLIAEIYRGELLRIASALR